MKTALALGRHTQAVIIAVLSFVQESRASNALALLRQRLTIQVRVLRDGLWRLAPAQDLVPGDVVHLRMGDLMPADVLLHDGHVLADQSALTGESAPGKPPMPAAPSGVARPPAKLRPPDGAPASARRRNWCEPPARPATWKP